MNHNFESQEWAENHQILSNGIDRIITSARNLIMARVRPETPGTGDQPSVASSPSPPDDGKFNKNGVNVA